MPGTDTRKPWYRLTPERLVLALILAEGGLLVADRFYLFGLSRGDFWNLQLATRLVVGFALLGLAWLVIGLLLERRPQFSLRFLLLLTVAVAIPGSWYAAWVETGRRQGEALAQVRQIQSRLCQGKRHRQARYGSEFVKTVSARREIVVGVSFAIDEDLGCGCCYGATETDLCDEDLRSLGRFHRLQQLEAPDGRITDAGLACVASLKDLRHLDLSGNAITDAGLAQLRGLKRLEHLNISNTIVTDAGFAHLSRLKKLQQIDFDSTAATGVGIKQLAGCESMKKCVASLSPEGVCTFNRLRNLENLHATLDRFSSGDLSGGSIRFDGHPSLKTLILQNGLQLESVELSNLPALEQIILRAGTCVHGGRACRECVPEVESLRLENLPNLTSLYVTNTRHLLLRDVPNLNGIRYDGVVDYEHFRQIDGLPQLQGLSVHATGLLSPDLLAVSGRLPSLEALSISGDGLTDESLAALEQYPALKRLSLPVGDFSEKGLAHLRTLESLENLSIGRVRDAGEPLACVAELPRLRSIAISGGEIGTLRLVAMPKLEKIDLQRLHIGSLELADLPGVSRVRLGNSSVERVSVKQLPLLKDFGLDVPSGREPPQTIELEGLPGLTCLSVPGLVKEPVFSDDDLGQFTSLVELTRRGSAAAVSDRTLYRLVESSPLRRVYARDAETAALPVEDSP